MEIDQIDYTHRQANFMAAKNHALKLVGLLKQGIKIVDQKVDIDFGAIGANLGSPEMQAIETFIFDHVTVTAHDGQPIRLSNAVEINAHFNQYRAHYFKLIFDGIVFHFGDFLPAGLVSVKNINL